ncbi:unnamed protein product [Ceutorhynchus assimilis]|uniref:Beta-glucosidase n=1 Tax=Ceutorhynchus assimilis TaxID=467358 RepID=A0A9N9QIX1_9CUCU|nr:unnamed protein product [Ceutorhynchus assimilis]
MKLFFLLVCLFIERGTPLCQKCFPSDFLWGTATSSYQIEGAWNISDKGENIWDWFVHTYPENITNQGNGDIASDFYHHYEEDIDLMANLSAQVYRMSLSWARILPNGKRDYISEEGVNFYKTIFEKLRSKNIEPVVTIYHWELPMTMHELGGWVNPEMADYFADYASVCYELFGSYVKYWVTVNEPYMQCIQGYGSGIHAPGITDTGVADYQCLYAQLLAHAKAYHIYNDTFKATQNGTVGIALVSQWYEPLTDSEEDKLAVERGMQWMWGLQMNPIIYGNWPQIVIDRIGNFSIAQGLNSSRLPEITQKDTALIKGSFDFVGLNYYTTFYASAMTENISDISYNSDRGIIQSSDKNWVLGANTWLHDVPSGLRKILKWISINYRSPRILITENGWSDLPEVVNDTERINYIQGHTCSLLQAKYVDQVDVFGYIYWSLTNSFEWKTGYSEGFGLIQIDFNSPNRTRTPRASYYYYKNLIETNCLKHCAFR